jgi:hypothetical protein
MATTTPIIASESANTIAVIIMLRMSETFSGFRARALSAAKPITATAIAAPNAGSAYANANAKFSILYYLLIYFLILS